MYQIILASGSPRRKEILEQVGVTFTIIPSEKEERITSSKPEEVVKELSFMKAKDIADKVSGNVIVIGADTVVAYKNKILGKPKDKADAYNMIKELQGNSHFVYTGIAVIIKEEGKEERELSFFEETKVSVYKMTENQINDYVETGEAADKAGAYGIQGKFAIYIKELVGDYYNVVGFPIASLHKILQEENIDLLHV